MKTLRTVSWCRSSNNPRTLFLCGKCDYIVEGKVKDRAQRSLINVLYSYASRFIQQDTEQYLTAQNVPIWFLLSANLEQHKRNY